VNVDTGTFAAITAETAMLREHAARGRRRATGPRERRPWRPMDGYWWGGRAAGMRDLLELAGDMAQTATSARPVLAAILDMAEGVAELQDIEVPPSEWSGEAGTP
jgi:hypothetical protein